MRATKTWPSCAFRSARSAHLLKNATPHARAREESLAFSDGSHYDLTPRRWTGIKKRLGFCGLTQDSDDEGCLYLERLPKADEAVLIREAIGIRKRRHLTPEALVALERARASIKTPFRGGSVRQNETPATTLPESEAA